MVALKKTKVYLSPALLEPAEHAEKAKMDQNGIAKRIRQIICISFSSASSAASERDIFFIPTV
jgi:hypothetical protein